VIDYPKGLESGDGMTTIAIKAGTSLGDRFELLTEAYPKFEIL
jgi:hypothetical protein